MRVKSNLRSVIIQSNPLFLLFLSGRRTDPICLKNNEDLKDSKRFEFRQRTRNEVGNVLSGDFKEGSVSESNVSLSFVWSRKKLETFDLTHF